MRIWIDADACPRDVKDVVFRVSERRGISVVLVANKAMHTPRAGRVSQVHVKGGPDVADDRIVLEAEAGDLCVTHDIPLAARLVAKRVLVIDPRGDVYNEENVRERLSVRDFLAEVRESGVITGGPASYSARDKQRFANALDRALQAARGAR
ncbi:MAG: YaiI/YqxD family protein [Deltaproteobacteria bacterium]|nr:YaiI/YqxD family protein [Deltaproteobacteria bacterium]